MRCSSELDRQLDAAGLILRRGTMLDATVIETTAARPPRGGNGELDADAFRDEDMETSSKPSRPSDRDARFTRRKGTSGSSYGYKAHVGVDQGSGLIRRVITTPANVTTRSWPTTSSAGMRSAVLADSAYHTMPASGFSSSADQAALMRRANKHQRDLRQSWQGSTA